MCSIITTIHRDHLLTDECQSGDELYHSYSDFGTVRCFYLNGRNDVDKRSWYTSLQACKYVRHQKCLY